MATNQFAPRVGASQLGNAPLISVAALAGVPEFVRGAFGERVLRKARQAAMLDFELIEDSDCFIPQLTMTTFTHTVARMAGEEHLGLKLAPYLTVASYGSWGEYLLGARTLGSAIRRAAATMEFHARGDALSLDLIDGCARISYVSAARGLDGYVHVAWGTIGAILSLCKAYLPRFWRPHCIEVDVAAPRRQAIFEDTFECPVTFGTPKLAVWLDASTLRSAAHRAGSTLLTVGDMARARSALHRTSGLKGVVAHQVWAQILTGSVSIESTARSLDTSVRTLQRELSREGADFRTMVNALRGKRAVELLSETEASVTQISTTLGYSAPAHFARAFRKATGVGPREFRRTSCGTASIP
ncbi:MAG: AraC family transcriptional regulator ligand-binding domain-containing protein [Rubrivivax sp.]|nr:AraC family transcriptional regulator ligand-binding domain-containing protein [Rubrivivax sp.]